MKSQSEKTSAKLGDDRLLRVIVAKYLLTRPESETVSRLLFAYSTFSLPYWKTGETKGPIAVCGDDTFACNRVETLLTGWNIQCEVISDESRLRNGNFLMVMEAENWKSRVEDFHVLIQYWIKSALAEVEPYRFEAFSAWTLRWMYLLVAVMPSEDLRLSIRDTILESASLGRSIVDQDILLKTITRRFGPTPEQAELGIVDPMSAWTHEFFFSGFNWLNLHYAARERVYPPLYSWKRSSLMPCAGLVTIPWGRTESFLRGLYQSSFGYEKLSEQDKSFAEKLLWARCVDYDEARAELNNNEEHVPPMPTDCAVARTLGLSLKDVTKRAKSLWLGPPWTEDELEPSELVKLESCLGLWPFISGAYIPIQDDYKRVFYQGKVYELTLQQSEIIKYLASLDGGGASLSQICVSVPAVGYEPPSLRDVFQGVRDRELLGATLKCQSTRRHAVWFLAENLITVSVDLFSRCVQVEVEFEAVTHRNAKA